MSIVTITKTALFTLMQSHNKLAEAEYCRNPSYTDSHFSAIAEHILIAELDTKTLNEYFKWLEDKTL